ncbi:MAG: hypothetical protein IIB95_09975 [Candidatus Marinimicrobia bacterium]|nr:hypothetical protein [Candidatus Neomarinimicrobiota bacterium]
MKNFKIILFVSIFVSSSLFAIGGFGLQLGQSMFSVAESSPATGSQFVTLTNSSFENSFNLGGYLYIDAIPFIDLEVDVNVRGNTYDINFKNDFGPMDPIQFGWLSTDVYFTLRKKVFGLSIPFLAGAKIHAGGGFNTHLTTPIASVEMIEDLLGGDLLTGNVDNLDKNLEDFLTDKDNYIEASGLHIQVGFQFKLLILDTFLNYRYTIVEDVVPGASGFGSLNLRIGIGI